MLHPRQEFRKTVLDTSFMVLCSNFRSKPTCAVADPLQFRVDS